MKSPLLMTQSSNFSTTAFVTALPATRSRKMFKKALPTSESALKRHNAWQVAPNLITSFRYAWAGVQYAFLTQRNFRIHTMMACVALSLAIYVRVEAVAVAIICLTSALVMVLELLNTALESVVDLTVGQTYHELAKIAKDCAAGAVLISAIAALIVASFILIPAVLALFA